MQNGQTSGKQAAGIAEISPLERWEFESNWDNFISIHIEMVLRKEKELFCLNTSVIVILLCVQGPVQIASLQTF